MVSHLASCFPSWDGLAWETLLWQLWWLASHSCHGKNQAAMMTIHHHTPSPWSGALCHHCPCPCSSHHCCGILCHDHHHPGGTHVHVDPHHNDVHSWQHGMVLLIYFYSTMYSLWSCVCLFHFTSILHSITLPHSPYPTCPRC